MPYNLKRQAFVRLLNFGSLKSYTFAAVFLATIVAQSYRLNLVVCLERASNLVSNSP